jgi:hypothetical protein
MDISPEQQRFIADHASPESLARFMKSAGPSPDLKSLAAAAQAQGYGLTEADVAVAIEEATQAHEELLDEALDVVTGGNYVMKNLRSPFD